MAGLFFAIEIRELSKKHIYTSNRVLNNRRKKQLA